MYSAISEIPITEKWRIFSSNLDDFPCTINHDDYVIIKDLLGTSLKNVFDIDYNLSDHFDADLFNYEKAVFDLDVINNQKRKKVNFIVDIPLYSIDFSFNFVQIEQVYVFETCFFSIKNKDLLSKLPVGNSKQDIIYATCHFSEDKKYNGTQLNYRQSILNQRSDKTFISGIPFLSYKYHINEKSISLQLEYIYKKFNRDDFSNYPNFSINFSDINNEFLFKLKQLEDIFTYHTDNFDLSIYYPELNNISVHDSDKMRNFVHEFLDNPRTSENMLVIEMMTI
jgi:hypothetical protein